MKIAIVCDWLTGMRGGERCLDAACEIYPQADIFTLIHVKNAVSRQIESHKISTSLIQKLPGRIENFRRYLLFFPHAIRRLDLSNYDLVLSFSHCVAKGVKAPKGIPHICYCHTPMRYAWHMRDEYLGKYKGVKRLAAEISLDYLKHWDRKTSAGVTHFIATSKTVSQRIKDDYNRNSTIINPPVECDRFRVSEVDDDYYLIVSAMVPYKRIDLAISVFNTLDRNLLIVGNGPELGNLKALSCSRISFVENADDKQVAEYMQRCRALIFPGLEDFGIVPLEAQACGKPVIAFGGGGALETVIDLDLSVQEDATGLFFYEQTPDSLLKAICRFEEIREKFKPQTCRKNAMRFDRRIYQQAMKSYLSNVTAGL
jgi:glycosyltransferase involved in cell wall biosynthesis